MRDTHLWCTVTLVCVDALGVDWGLLAPRLIPSTGLRAVYPLPGHFQSLLEVYFCELEIHPKTSVSYVTVCRVKIQYVQKTIG